MSEARTKIVFLLFFVAGENESLSTFLAITILVSLLLQLFLVRGFPLRVLSLLLLLEHPEEAANVYGMDFREGAYVNGR